MREMAKPLEIVPAVLLAALTLWVVVDALDSTTAPRTAEPRPAVPADRASLSGDPDSSTDPDSGQASAVEGARERR